MVAMLLMVILALVIFLNVCKPCQAFLRCSGPVSFIVLGVTILLYVYLVQWGPKDILLKLGLDVWGSFLILIGVILISGIMALSFTIQCLFTKITSFRTNKGILIK